MKNYFQILISKILFAPLTTLFLLLPLMGTSLLIGCSGSSSGSLSSGAPSSDAPKLLSITPLTKTVALGASLNLEAAGGTEPYSFDIYYGNGSVTSSAATGATGTYQAPNSEGSAVIRVQDAAGNAGYASVEIINSPVIQPTSKTLAVNNKFPFAVLSGKAPYVFSIASGDGSINNTTGEFTAGNSAGAVVVRVADADGRTADASVTVNAALSFTDKNVYVEKSAVYALTATGGVAPYTYSLASGAGSVDKTTGVFTAPNTLGVSAVQIVDAVGNFDLAFINITTALSISPSNALIAKNGNLLFSAIGGVPPYTYSLTSGTGAIVAATGAYTAPTSTGSTTVRVTDSLGHTSNSTVSITNNLTFSVANLVLAVGNSFDISTIVNGGIAPLTYAAPHSQGLFVGSTYTAPNTPGNYTLTVYDAQSPTPNSVTMTVLVNSELILLPTTTSVAIAGQKNFSASGGVPPYTYSVQSGGGVLTHGLYTAPTTSGNAVILVTDARGNTATAAISIQAVLAIVPTTKTLNANEAFTFTASGGNTPYTYSLISGSGAINSSSGLYTAPGSSGLSTVRVEDATGNHSDALITILTPLSISPPAISLIRNGAITFTASGGAGPYSFSMAGGDGDVNATTGMFTAAATAGTSAVRVTDSLGSFKDAAITVYGGLSISPFTKNLAVNQTFTFTATGGQAPYSYSLASGVGSVSTEGAYSSTMAGAAVVLVTDASGNTSDASVNVNSILTITPTSKTLGVNNQFSFSATGGVPPYAFSVLSGSGTVTTSGDYKAPATSTNAVVRVTDADGTTADSTVTVNDALTISPVNSTLAAGGTQSFIAAGGVGPYIYTVISGGGAFTGATYTAAAIASGANVNILVTDAIGNTANATITINPISVAISSPNSSDAITNTNKASFAVSGTCTESGQAVNIAATDGVNTAITATATCTSAAWSTSLNLTSLNDSAITITANHSNINNVAATPATVTLIKDGTAATITITAPTANSYISNSVTLTGSCSENGRPISISVTGGITANTTCNDNSYSKLLDLSSVADGALTITANHADAAGNAATPASVNVTKNSAVPTITISAPSTNIINSTGTVSFTLTYTGVANISIGTADIIYTGDSTGCAATISGSGTTSRTLAITSCSGNGSLQINIAANSAQNTVGTQTAASSLSTAVTVDNILPVITGLADDATTHATKDWSWSCTETNGPCTYRFLVDTTASTPTFTGSFVTTSTASQLTGSGTYYLHVQAKDAAGNISNTTNVSTILNNTAVTVALSAPSSSIMKATDTITYTATYSGAASISLANNDIVFTGISSGCAATVSGTGLSTRTISVTGCIGDGSLQINITASSAQNSVGAQATASSLSTAVTVDNTLPVLTGLTNDATAHKTKTWSWGCTETNGPCTYRYTIDTNPTFPFTVEAFAATSTADQLTGTNIYYLHIEAKDAAGNISTRTDVSTILDNTAPSAPSSLALNTPASSPGTVATPIIQVSGIVSSDTVKLFSSSDCTTQISSGTASGTTILLTTTTLTAGTYSFYANSTDPVGNISACSSMVPASVAYVLDLTNAAVTNVTASSNGPFTTGGTVTISVQFTKVVNVTGTPVLALTTGRGGAQASYDSGTGSNTLVFNYIVVSPDTTSDLTYTDTSSLTLADGTIKDNAGNDAALTLPTVGAAGSLTANKQIVLDTTAPTAPSALVDGNLVASTGTSPTITFTSGTDTGGSGILKHQIQVVLSSATATIVKNWADFTSGSKVTGATFTDGVTYKVQVKAVDNAFNESTVTMSDGWTVDATAPTAPSSLALQNPASSPSMVATPTITIGGVTSGDTIYLYSDSCITLVASGVTSGTTINLTTSTLELGTYTFKAKAADSIGNTSACSTASLAYERVGWSHQAYLKAPNAEANDQFGTSVAISGDTIVVGAPNEASNQTTITNGSTASVNNTAGTAGAVYVFKRTDTTWAQEAYLKAPNAQISDSFGYSVAISGDSIVVGAAGDDSNQTAITNGTTASTDNTKTDAGSAYVFKRTGTTWAQEAYLKAPNAEMWANFGSGVSINGDSIVVAAMREYSAQTYITNGTTASTNTSAPYAGAAYVFKRTGTAWAQEAYLKAPNVETNDYFGSSVAISGDSIVVGAYAESSNQTTITNGATASTNNSALAAGATYVFKRTGTTWAQEAYLKTPNAEAYDNFGSSVAISGDSIVTGARGDDSNQTSITNGTAASANNSANGAGAAYVFKRTGTTWEQEAYLKAPNTNASDGFGASVSISGDRIVVGAALEDSIQTTVTNGTTASADNSDINIGAAYVFKRTGTSWGHEAYLKAPNLGSNFGNSVAINGNSIIVGSYYESSNQTTITNGTAVSNNYSATKAGAAYVFTRPSIACPTGYIVVPALEGYTTSEFCVAKYEMKDVSGVATSIAAGTPWVSIARGTDATTVGGAWKACKDLGTGYDLISNAQWQTIARNIADQATNWNNNSAASGTTGQLNRGHSDNAPANALAASTDNDPYYGTSNTNADAWNGGTYAAGDEQKRTHTLSNGNVIWDFAGNVFEWVKDNNSSSQGTDDYVSNFNSGDSRQTNYGNDNFCASPSANPYCNMGYGTTNSSVGAVIRGGYWNNAVSTGIFAAHLGFGPTGTGTYIGFRCVYTP